VKDDPAGAHFYRVLRLSTVRELAERIGEETGQDPTRIRLWCMVNRQNKTTRPDQPIMDPEMTVEEAQMKLAASKQQELRLWAEVAEEVDANGEPIWPSFQAPQNGAATRNEKILLFLKWFDLESQTLRGVGHVYIGKERRVEELVPLILKKMGWPETNADGSIQQLKIFEEIKPQMIEAMKAKQTLKAAELQDGDIICFQKSEKPFSEIEREGSHGKETVIKPPSTVQGGLFDDARQYYEHLLYKKLIKLYPVPRMQNTPYNKPFDLIVSSKYNYDQFAVKVGAELDVDPTHIRFHTVNNSTGNPKQPVKRNPALTLHHILSPPYSSFGNNNQRSDSLYYEVLDMSLSELDTKKNFKVTWLSDGIVKEVSSTRACVGMSRDTYYLLGNGGRSCSEGWHS
jgi:ubiquitin carboxyl-terminal hydrolase 7